MTSEIGWRSVTCSASATCQTNRPWSESASSSSQKEVKRISDASFHYRVAKRGRKSWDGGGGG